MKKCGRISTAPTAAESPAAEQHRPLTLLCLPYAGGSASLYYRFRPFLSGLIEICSLEYAGHGRRINEPLYQSINEGVDDLLDQATPQLSTGPYAIFGHSLGCIFAYELAQRIRREGLPQPTHLVCSGRGAPHVPKKDREIYHRLSPEEFEAALVRLGGTPPELFQEPELMALVLPILRNDFRLADCYPGHPTDNPFDFDITVLAGTEEDLSEEQLSGWSAHTTGRCHLHRIPGDHFFLTTRLARTTSVLKLRLCPPQS